MSDAKNSAGYGQDNKGAAGGTDLNKGKPAVFMRLEFGL